ncbi:helix-turn-helix domain-containing protein [Chitinimonas arctica]|uniref:Helix-turn-helix domain-containing protein n=1 Tax=Chitinimonas arctica TaxID=2594795 RepID=A0A516SB37_9NEIS|nr:helix-turn-helix domain-containing protein [Chitinimonas arctica]QDQ25362.1 helix-turn-helix domain-containing protein [Chitinimonas arctica]
MPAERTAAPLPVYFLLLPGFLLLDFAGPAEALRIAQRLGVPFELRCIGPDAMPVSSLGVPVAGVAPLPDSLPAGCWLFIPGLLSKTLVERRADTLAAVKWLKRVWRPDIQLATICSAAVLAGEAGLLDGRSCTTHHTLTETLRQCAPRAKVADNRVFVIDGNIASSAGVTTGIDLTLALIGQLAGPKLALDVAREMVVWLRRDSETPQLSPFLSHRNHLHPAVHRVQDAIAAEPARDWSRDSLAALACVSPRHLDRLFKLHTGLAPLDYRQQIQLAQAEPLLARLDWSLERIAEAAGFGSARDLRRVWLKQRGTPLKRKAAPA